MIVQLTPIVICCSWSTQGHVKIIVAQKENFNFNFILARLFLQARHAIFPRSILVIQLLYATTFCEYRDPKSSYLLLGGGKQFIRKLASIDQQKISLRKEKICASLFEYLRISCVALVWSRKKENTYQQVKEAYFQSDPELNSWESWSESDWIPLIRYQSKLVLYKYKLRMLKTFDIQ